MFENYAGELAALATAFLWTGSALSFEVAGKQLGSLSLNLIRLVIGLVFLTVFSYFYRGLALPTDADMHTWLWLCVSGLIGFVLGDLLLFQAFILIGARISMLLMALAPPFTAIISWLLMDEVLTFGDLAGMLLVIAGIALVVLSRQAPNSNGDDKNRRVKLNFPVAGLLLGIGAALGQAGGLVFSKFGMKDYDAFAATQIRVIAGIIGFAFFITLSQKWKILRKGLNNKKGMLFATLGSFFGPFLGVAFSLLAVQQTKAGVASTIMAIVPVLIIPPTIIIYRQKISPREIIGAFVTVLGVCLLFI